MSTEQLLNLPESIVIAESPEDADTSDEKSNEESDDGDDLFNDNNVEQDNTFDFDEDFYR